MLRQLINLDGYWLATVIYIPQERDMPGVADALAELGCPDEDIQKTWRLMTEEWNKGYKSSGKKKFRKISREIYVSIE